jgi:hypothetical protein
MPADRGKNDPLKKLRKKERKNEKKWLKFPGAYDKIALLL